MAREFFKTDSVQKTLILALEHDRGQTDSQEGSQRLSAAHHNVTWSILIGLKFLTATPTHV